MLAHSVWTCEDGRQVTISKMHDNHIKNAIRMIERQGKTDSFSYECLCAERDFRANQKPSQTELPLDMPEVPVKVPVSPVKSLLRIKAMGTLPRDSMKLTRDLDAIGLKYHGFNTFDDLDEDLDEDW